MPESWKALQKENWRNDKMDRSKKQLLAWGVCRCLAIDHETLLLAFPFRFPFQIIKSPQFHLTCVGLSH
jgi:hypothetical protein